MTVQDSPNGSTMAAIATSGIPTARSVDHVGVNVADLGAAITFFTDVLGAQLLFEAGPFQDPEGQWMAEQLGVHPRAVLYLAMMRLGPTLNIELMQYKVPGVSARAAAFADPGAGHLAIYVDDIERAVAYLADQPGVSVLGQITKLEGELPNAGTSLIFVSTPIGVLLELICRSGSLPYERTTKARLVGPADNWHELKQEPQAK
ncbi:VOC family protein [Sphingobium sp. B2]|uniref:VOC family protein n=1 Tax=Sphingobium sp. B2 TaxID=2583228 RepID=UPI00119CA91C|nr:VOC family protein [Sphingobium sp. B2]